MHLRKCSSSPSTALSVERMLRDGVVHRDLGADHFDRLDRDASVSRNVRRLEKLGYQVSLQPMAS
jgi:hypothetical protein